MPMWVVGRAFCKLVVAGISDAEAVFRFLFEARTHAATHISSVSTFANLSKQLWNLSAFSRFRSVILFRNLVFRSSNEEKLQRRVCAKWHIFLGMGEFSLKRLESRENRPTYAYKFSCGICRLPHGMQRIHIECACNVFGVWSSILLRWTSFLSPDISFLSEPIDAIYFRYDFFLLAGHQMSGCWLKSFLVNVICFRLFYSFCHMRIAYDFPMLETQHASIGIAKYNISPKWLQHESVVMKRYIVRTCVWSWTENFHKLLYAQNKCSISKQSCFFFCYIYLCKAFVNASIMK